MIYFAVYYEQASCRTLLSKSFDLLSAFTCANAIGDLCNIC